MIRRLIPRALVLSSFTFMAMAPGPAAGNDIKIQQQWSGTVRDNTQKAAAPGPAIGDAETLAKAWKAWAVKGDMPKVDFSKDLILIAFADGPNVANVANIKLDPQGNATLLAMQTEMAGPGFGYALVLVDRAGIKTVEGKPVPAPPAPAAATATQQGAISGPAEIGNVDQEQPGTVPGAVGGGVITVHTALQTVGLSEPGTVGDNEPANKVKPPAPAPAAPAGAQVLATDQYGGYFVKNNYEPNAERSLVVATTQDQFDAVFGAGFVMNDRSHRLAAGSFDKQLVIAIIRRGPAMTDFALNEVSLADGTATVKYDTHAPAAAPGASFASPLIFSVDKTGIKKIVFIENGKEVGTQEVK